MPDHPSIDQLERRVRADPLSIAFAALAEEYRRAGRYEEAIEVCQTGLARHPAYVSARVTLGRALIAVGQLREAAEELEGVLRMAPENLAAIRALAEIHQRRATERGGFVAEEPGAEVPPVAPAAGAREGAPSAEAKRAEPTLTQPPETTAAPASEGDVHVVESAPADTGPRDMPSRDQLVLQQLQRFLDGVLALKRDRAAGHIVP